MDTPGLHLDKLKELDLDVTVAKGPLEEEELLNIIRNSSGFDGLLCGRDNLNAKVLEAFSPRLKIISSLCQGEKNVSELLTEIKTTQPNMSQHLNTLFKSGVLAKRRDGVQIYYRIANEQVVNVCKAVCLQVSEDQASQP